MICFQIISITSLLKNVNSGLFYLVKVLLRNKAITKAAVNRYILKCGRVWKSRFNAAHDTVNLCFKSILLVHVQLGVHQDPLSAKLDIVCHSRNVSYCSKEGIVWE